MGQFRVRQVQHSISWAQRDDFGIHRTAGTIKSKKISVCNSLNWADGCTGLTLLASELQQLKNACVFGRSVGNRGGITSEFDHPH
jgi:hypothetical protein